MNTNLSAWLLGLFLFCSTVHGENVDQREGQFSPYFWLPSMDVTSTVEGRSVDLDLDFEDILDDFDVFAISARGEYWWGEWGVVADGLYMDMETDNVGSVLGVNPPVTPLQDTELRITDGMLDILAAYRFNITGDDDGASVRLMAGGRYRYIKQKITNIPIPGNSSAGGSEDYVEPLIGAQLLAPLSENWLFTTRGDIGGFGIGAASDLSWSAMAGVGWSFADNWMAKLGYRYEYIDYSKGSGSNEFALDGNMQGPWIGIGYGM